jgi:hypothetical protein
MATMFRIATVKATGKKYIVNYIDFRANKVVCWGEVTKRVGLKTWHGPNKVLLLDAVEIGPEQVKDEALMQELVDQMIHGLREEGHQVDVRTSSRGNIRYQIIPKRF